MTDFKTTFEQKCATYESIANPLALQPVNLTINLVAEELHRIGLDLQEQIRNSDNPDSLNKEVASIFTDITSRRIHPDADSADVDAQLLRGAIGYGILAGLTDTEVFKEE